MVRNKACLSFLVLAVVLSLAVSIAGCGGDTEADNGHGVDGEATSSIAGATSPSRSSGTDFSLTSKDFKDDSPMPPGSACADLGGANTSPQLTWQAAPGATTSYALVMDDEDPPCGTGDDACRHWAVYNIPAIVTSLDAGQDITRIGGAAQGETYEGGIGYAGPCPPKTHVYKFTIYALGDGMPDISEGTSLTRSQFVSTYSEYILASDTLSGSFTP